MTYKDLLDTLQRLLDRVEELEAVADAARELARQWKEEVSGQPLGWLIDTLADALDALDAGATPHRDALLESYDRYVERYGLAPKG